MTYVDRKTRGNVYGNEKKIIDDDIAVSPCMAEYRLNLHQEEKSRR